MAESIAAGAAAVDPYDLGHLGHMVSLTKQDQDLVRQIAGAWVMIVRTNGGVQRRCWLSAATAVKHARHAQELGHQAWIYRVELWPARRLTGWEVAPR